MRRLRFLCLTLGLTAFVTAVLPRDAAAQAPREGMGVGVVLIMQAGAGPVLSVRYTKPVSEKVAFDFDVGWTLRRAQSRLGNPPSASPAVVSRPKWLASGLIGGARMRWLPAGRSETGWSGALSFGASIMHSGIYTREERQLRAWVIVPDLLNVTVDKLSENGFRVGGSVGGVTSVPVALRSDVRKQIIDSFGNLPMFYASAFGAAVQK